MPIFNPTSLQSFWASLQKLDFARQLLASSFLLLAILYPGHNPLQVLTIQAGPVSSLPPTPVLAAYPLFDGSSPPPTMARAVVVQDLASKTILYAKAPDTQYLPASTTKLMTALVALDNYSLDDTLTITPQDLAIGHTMDLVVGESISVHNLLYGLLVESGNDAAQALANHHPAGYAGFVAEMNAKAQALNLAHTTYRNPSGIESYGHLTSARDLAVLASHALTSELIRTIVGTKQIVVTDTAGTLSHSLTNTNQLLGELAGVQGLKTGWTENAGECLVTYIEREGRGLILVVLGSDDRFGDTRALVDWAYSHHTWVTPQ